MTMLHTLFVKIPVLVGASAFRRSRQFWRALKKAIDNAESIYLLRYNYDAYRAKSAAQDAKWEAEREERRQRAAARAIAAHLASISDKNPQ